MAFELTESNFDAQKNGNEVVVIDFWATWCGPCRQIAPIIEELATEYAGSDNSEKVLIGKLDVDNNRKVAMQYGIRSIPTIVILKNGEVADKHVGTISKTKLQAKIDAQLELA